MKIMKIMPHESGRVVQRAADWPNFPSLKIFWLKIREKSYC